MDVDKTVCFIGHRKIPADKEFSAKTENVIKELVEQGYCIFLFGDHSEFNSLCYDIISELKNEFQNMRRIHYRTNPPELDDYSRKFYLDGYEDSICPDSVANAGKAAYIQRNRAMICDSKVCVFYYDSSYSPTTKKRYSNDTAPSGTKAAYEFAVKQKKNIITI